MPGKDAAHDADRNSEQRGFKVVWRLLVIHDRLLRCTMALPVVALLPDGWYLTYRTAV